MFLRKTPRKKDGKTHDYWSAGREQASCRWPSRAASRSVLGGDRSSSPGAAVWRKAIEDAPMTTRDIRGHSRCSPKIAAPASRPTRRSSNFACRTCGYAGRANGAPVGSPGSCGGSWNSLSRFWADRLPPSRKGTQWDQVLQGAGLNARPDRAGQRVEAASRLVRQECHGRPAAGGRLRIGRGAPALRLP